MGYEGEPTNPLGADQFIGLVTDEDIRFLDQDVKEIVQQLKRSLNPTQDIKTFNHRLDAKIISVSVDGGNQQLFKEIPAIGMSLIRVSSSSEELKRIPDSFLHIVRTRNLAPVLDESDQEVAQKREDELNQLFETKEAQRFFNVTGIDLLTWEQAFGETPKPLLGLYAM